MAGWSGGIFTRARNWVQDKTNAINPQAALFDQEDDNFATGLNNCVTKDGLNKPSATMDFNAQTLKNVGNPLFSAQRTTSALTLPASTVTTIIFNTEYTDVGAGYDIATGIYTVPVTGQYLFCTSLFITNNASGTALYNGLYLSKNNATALPNRWDLTTTSGALSAGGGSLAASASVILALTATDTIRIKADISTIGGAGSLTANITSHFSGYMLG